MVWLIALFSLVHLRPPSGPSGFLIMPLGRVVQYQAPGFLQNAPAELQLENKKQQSKKLNLDHPTNFQESNADGDSDPKDIINVSNQDTTSDDHVPVIIQTNYSIPSHNDAMDPIVTSPNVGGLEQLPGLQLQALIGMIRNAEKNIHLLNQARIRALEDLEKILSEKESLQGELNVLEMKLAESDARLRVAAQEKIHVELLEDHLEKLQNELLSGNFGVKPIQEMTNGVSSSQTNVVSSISQELNLLRAENMSLKDELRVLRAEL